VATLAFGRAVVAFVAALANLVGRILELWRFGAVVTGPAGTFVNAIVVTCCAVGDIALVLGVVKGHCTWLGIKFNFGGAIVGDYIGSNTYKGDHDHDRKKLFHLLFSSSRVSFFTGRVGSSCPDVIVENLQ
jgi:hypothetical protein